MRQSRIRDYFLGTVFAALVAVGTPLPAHAGIVGTDQLLQAGQPSLQVAEVQQWLQRADVREKLVSLGVDPQQASLRVASLTEQELQQVAQRITIDPAGGGVLAVVGIVFVVLLILELVGVTNIFTRI
jgi:hypothetical protein